MAFPTKAAAAAASSLPAPPVLFFFVAVAFKAPFTAIGSLLGQLAASHGPESLLWLNFAYFLPPVPLTALLSLAHGYLDARLGPGRSAALRLGAGLTGLAALSLAFPSAARAPGAAQLLGVTAGIGACYAAAYAAAYTALPSFEPACTVALTAGYVSAGVVILALDVCIKRGAAHYSARQLDALFAAVAAVCLAGAAAGVPLMLRLGGRPGRSSGSEAAHKHHRGGGLGPAGSPERDGGFVVGGGSEPAFHRRHPHHSSPTPGDGSGAAAAAAAGGAAAAIDLEAPAAARRHSSSDGGGRGAPHVQPHRLTSHPQNAGEWRAVALAIAPAAAALFVSVGTSMAAFPFFSYTPADGAYGLHMASALFYARLGGDIAGRLAPRAWQANSVRRLAAAAAIKTALQPLLLPALLRPALAGGDRGLLALVALNWALSGAVATGAYLVAPALVPAHRRARAGGVMALCFQTSCFAGLLAATLLQGLLAHGHGSGGGGAKLAAHAAAAAAAASALAPPSLAPASASAASAVIPPAPATTAAV